MPLETELECTAVAGFIVRHLPADPTRRAISSTVQYKDVDVRVFVLAARQQTCILCHVQHLLFLVIYKGTECTGTHDDLHVRIVLKRDHDGLCGCRSYDQHRRVR